MEENEENKGEDAEEEIKVYVDPKLFKPDLYAAASANDTTAVLDFLSKKTPGTYIDTKTGWTALHWAAINGNYKMITRLLECNASEPYHRLANKARKEKEMLNGTHRAVRRKKVEENGTDESKFATITEGEDDEDEEAAENMDFDKQIEVSVNLLKNTPLLWATHKAHLRVIWPLLADGYSPNDVDNMGNTALHLAAAVGDLKILKVLIDDGASANIVNHYKNLPIDMAKNKETRDILALAMEAGASNTEADIAAKHEQNMKQYHRIVAELKSAVAEASVINDGSRALTVAQCSKLARVLSDATQVGKEYSLDEELLKEADALLLKLEASQDLTGDIQTLQQLVPIRVQSVYIENVYRLEKSIEKAAAAGVDPIQLQLGLALITRCQIEYWLSILLTRLKDVVTANDSNEHDMNRLKEAIAKAEELNANASLIGQGQKFLMRLEAELGMSRAIKALPVMKPHQENPPEGYYTERDVGHIKETEEYPLPPEGGDYIWVHSEAFTDMQAAIERIKLSYNGADTLGANAAIIAETKEKLIKAEKDLKILDAKETSDKAVAIEAAKKAAKKLKKKGGGKKK